MLQHGNRIRHEHGNDYVFELENEEQISRIVQRKGQSRRSAGRNETGDRRRRSRSNAT